MSFKTVEQYDIAIKNQEDALARKTAKIDKLKPTLQERLGTPE